MQKSKVSSTLEVVQNVERVLYDYLIANQTIYTERKENSGNTKKQESEAGIEAVENNVNHNSIHSDRYSIKEFCQLSQNLCEACKSEKDSPISMNEKERIHYVAQRAWNASALRHWADDEHVYKAHIRLWVTLLYLMSNYVFASHTIRTNYLTNHSDEAEKCIVMCVKTAKDMSSSKHTVLMEQHTEFVLSHAALIFDIVKVVLSHQAMYNSPVSYPVTQYHESEKEIVCMENQYQPTSEEGTELSCVNNDASTKYSRSKADVLNVEIQFARLSICWDLHWYEEAVQFATQLSQLTIHMVRSQEMLLQFIFTCAEHSLSEEMRESHNKEKENCEELHKNEKDCIAGKESDMKEDAIRRLLLISLHIQETRQDVNAPMHQNAEHLYFQNSSNDNSDNHYYDDCDNYNVELYNYVFHEGKNNGSVSCLRSLNTMSLSPEQTILHCTNTNSDNDSNGNKNNQYYYKTNALTSMTQKEILFHGVTLLQYAVSCLQSCKYEEAIAVSQQAQGELGSIEPYIVQLKALASLCYTAEALDIFIRLIRTHQLSCDDLFALAQVVIDGSSSSSSSSSKNTKNCAWNVLQIIWTEILPLCIDCIEKTETNETNNNLDDNQLCKRVKCDTFCDGNDNDQENKAYEETQKCVQEFASSFTVSHFTFRYVCLLLRYYAGEVQFVEELVRVLASCNVDVQHARFYFVSLWRIVQANCNECDDSNKLPCILQLECLKTTLRFAMAASYDEIEHVILHITSISFDIVFTSKEGTVENVEVTTDSNSCKYSNNKLTNEQKERLSDCYNLFAKYVLPSSSSSSSLTLYTEVCMCELSFFVYDKNHVLQRFRTLLSARSIERYTLSAVLAACGTLIQFFASHAYKEMAACMAEELLQPSKQYTSELSTHEVFALMRLCILHYLSDIPEHEENYHTEEVEEECSTENNTSNIADDENNKPTEMKNCKTIRFDQLLMQIVEPFLCKHFTELSDVESALWWCKLLWFGAETLHNTYNTNNENITKHTTTAELEIEVKELYNKEANEVICAPFAALHLTHTACMVFEHWHNKSSVSPNGSRAQFTESEIALEQERVMWMLKWEFDLFVFGGVEPHCTEAKEQSVLQESSEPNECEEQVQESKSKQENVCKECNVSAQYDHSYDLLPLCVLEHYITIMSSCYIQYTNHTTENNMALTLMLAKAEVILRNKRCNASQINSDYTCQEKSSSETSSNHCDEYTLPSVEALMECNANVHELERLASVMYVTGNVCNEVELVQCAIHMQLAAAQLACKNVQEEMSGKKFFCVEEDESDKLITMNMVNDKMQSILHILLILFHASRMCISSVDELQVYKVLQEQVLLLVQNLQEIHTLYTHGIARCSAADKDVNGVWQECETLMEYFAVEAWNNTVKLSSIYDKTNVIVWRSITTACCARLSQDNVTVVTIRDMLQQLHA